MMREEVSRGSLLSPLMLFAPRTALGSTQLAPVLLALPQQGPGSWDRTPSPLLAPTKTFPLLAAFLKKKTSPSPPDLWLNPTPLP